MPTTAQDFRFQYSLGHAVLMMFAAATFVLATLSIADRFGALVAVAAAVLVGPMALLCATIVLLAALQLAYYAVRGTWHCLEILTGARRME